MLEPTCRLSASPASRHLHTLFSFMKPNSHGSTGRRPTPRREPLLAAAWVTRPVDPIHHTPARRATRPRATPWLHPGSGTCDAIWCLGLLVGAPSACGRGARVIRGPFAQMASVSCRVYRLSVVILVLFCQNGRRQKTKSCFSGSHSAHMAKPRDEEGPHGVGRGGTRRNRTQGQNTGGANSM